jgi:hypothetical protein
VPSGGVGPRCPLGRDAGGRVGVGASQARCRRRGRARDAVAAEAGGPVTWRSLMGRSISSDVADVGPAHGQAVV